MFFKRFKASDMKEIYEEAKVKRQKNIDYIYKISIKKAFKDIKKSIEEGRFDVFVSRETNLFIQTDLEGDSEITSKMKFTLEEHNFNCRFQGGGILVNLKESIK